jgi:hypothetical protein
MHFATISRAPSSAFRSGCREERDSRSGRENSHQLFVRFERGSLFELDVEFPHLEEITREWREVVRVVPLPRGGPLVVVFENPTQSFDVRFDDTVTTDGMSGGREFWRERKEVKLTIS